MPLGDFTVTMDADEVADIDGSNGGRVSAYFLTSTGTQAAQVVSGSLQTLDWARPDNLAPAVSEGYALPLKTDKAAGAGDSTTTAYQVTWFNATARVTVQFMAPPAGTNLLLSNLVATAVPPELANFDVQDAATATLLETPTSASFIASENRAKKTEIVLGPYYGTYTASSGVIQSQTVLDNAIDAAQQQGGGVVVVPDTGTTVTHKVNQIVMPAFVHLKGAVWATFGDQGARIRQNSGVNAPLVIFDSNGNTAGRSYSGPCSITDLTLLGHVGSETGSHGIMTRNELGNRVLIQDMTLLERVTLAYFKKSGLFVDSGSPFFARNIVTLWNGGYGVEVVDAGYDTANGDLHMVDLAEIAGDGNLGYLTDAYGATVLVKGQRDFSAVTLRGIKSEYRLVPNFIGGQDGTKMGNAHAVILEDCAGAVSIDGVQHISTGSQTRRPDAAVLVKGTAQPNLAWAAVNIRGNHPSQTGTAVTTTVRNTVQGGVTVDHSAKSGELGAEYDARAVPEFTTGQSSIAPSAVAAGANPGSGTMRLSYWTAARTEVFATTRTIVTGAPTTTTLARIGLYEVAASGDLTLVASTANDTTLWASLTGGAGGTASYEKALSASYTVRRGQRYAWGIVWVGTGPLGVAGHSTVLTARELGKSPRRTGLVGSQTDLPASVTTASVSDTTQRYYVAAA